MPKYFYIILALNEPKNISQLSMETDTAYAHAYKIMKKLEESKIVKEVAKEKRGKYYELTERGKIVSKKVQEILSVISDERKKNQDIWHKNR